MGGRSGELSFAGFGAGEAAAVDEDEHAVGDDAGDAEGEGTEGDPADASDAGEDKTDSFLFRQEIG